MPVLHAFSAHVQDKTASALQEGCVNKKLNTKMIRQQKNQNHPRH
jgi:hypothetical protein